LQKKEGDTSFLRGIMLLSMKLNIHPAWHDDAVVTCACGNTFTTGSTLDKIDVDICAKCHPFFTGEMRFVDRQGRVDKFNKKMAAAQAVKSTQKKTPKQSDDTAQKSYQDILRDQRSQLREPAAPKA
jgi:large subunit ribosomal protein L31